jgi:hypothetical protein
MDCSAGDRTGPSPHNTAFANSNNASERTARQEWGSLRKRDFCADAFCRTSRCSRLILAAFD